MSFLQALLFTAHARPVLQLLCKLGAQAGDLG